MIKRKTGWDVALYDITVAAMARPHEWGVHDCITFGADCVLAMTGEDLIADLRGSYDSALSAAKIVKTAGFDSLREMIAARLPEIDVMQARRGDVVLCDGPAGEFLGVVTGHMCIGPSQAGLQHVSLAQAFCAFRVGDN